MTAVMAGTVAVDVFHGEPVSADDTTRTSDTGEGSFGFTPEGSMDSISVGVLPVPERIRHAWQGGDAIRHKPRVHGAGRGRTMQRAKM